MGGKEQRLPACSTAAARWLGLGFHAHCKQYAAIIHPPHSSCCVFRHLQGSTTTLTLPVYWVMRSVYQNAMLGSEGVSLYHLSGQIVAQVRDACKTSHCMQSDACPTALLGLLGMVLLAQ